MQCDVRHVNLHYQICEIFSTSNTAIDCSVSDNSDPSLSMSQVNKTKAQYTLSSLQHVFHLATTIETICMQRV